MSGSSEPSPSPASPPGAPPSGRPGASHLRGFAVLAGGQLLARALTFLTVTYLARALGVEMFGVVGFAAAVATYFLLCVDAGLDLVGMREITRTESSPDNVVSAVVAMRLALSILAGSVLWAVAPWLGPSPAGTAVILAYGLTLLSFTVNLKWAFQALEENAVVALALVVSQLGYLAGVLVFVTSPDHALRVPVLLFASELVGAGLLLARYARRGFRLRFPPPLALSWALLTTASPLGMARWSRTLQLNFDLLLLGLLDTPRTLGVYIAVSRIILLLREFAEMYFLPLFPGLSAAAAQDSQLFVRLARTGLRYAAVIIFPITVGGCLTAVELLSLGFGPEYAPGARPLCVLLVTVLVATLGGTYRMGLIAHGRQNVILGITAAGTALNVALNALLIPRYSMMGAAVSALASEVLIFALAWASFSRLVSLPPWRPAFAPAAATAGMASVLWLLPARPLGVTVAVGAAIYAVLAVLLRAIRPHELREALRGLPASASEERS